MLEYIRQWVLSISVTGILCTVFVLAAPSGKMKKSVKTVAALYMILAVITPMFKGEIKFNADSFNSAMTQKQQTQNQETLEQQVIQSAKEEIENQIKEILQNNQIEHKKIEVTILKNEKLYIEKVEISTATAKDVGELINLELGIEKEKVKLTGGERR